FGLRKHVLKIAYLQILPNCPIRYNESDVPVREISHQLSHDRNRGIVSISHAEDDLELGIVQHAKPGVILIRFKVCSVEGNHYRYREFFITLPNGRTRKKLACGDDGQ